MRELRRERGQKIISKVREEVRFLKNWAENPLTTGAVAPSGKALARLMAKYVDNDRAGKVVELGPGTGVVTRAMIDRGIPENKIVSVEYSENFVKLMHDRFPGVTVVRGDAYALEPQAELGTHKPLASVISSLPLFSRPPAERKQLINRALEMLEPGAPFIQFSYAPVPPVRQDEGDFRIDRTNWVVMNVPPARVWIYRRPA